MLNVSICYGFQGFLLFSSTALNVLHKPLHAMVLSLKQMFVLYVPLAFLGSYFFGVVGIFSALAFSYIITGIVARYIITNELTKSFAAVE